MNHPLRERAIAAVAGYRATADTAHLDLLRQDGQPGLAHALTMEQFAPDHERARYTAEIDWWLSR